VLVRGPSLFALQLFNTIETGGVLVSIYIPGPVASSAASGSGSISDTVEGADFVLSVAQPSGKQTCPPFGELSLEDSVLLNLWSWQALPCQFLSWCLLLALDVDATFSSCLNVFLGCCA